MQVIEFHHVVLIICRYGFTIGAHVSLSLCLLFLHGYLRIGDDANHGYRVRKSTQVISQD